MSRDLEHKITLQNRYTWQGHKLKKFLRHNKCEWKDFLQVIKGVEKYDLELISDIKYGVSMIRLKY